MTTDVRFDYGTLGEDLATSTREHADRIRELVKMTTEAAVEIGRRLLDVRGTLEPKVFLVWLRAEFRWSVPTAWKYMASAEHFGHLDCLDKFDRSALHTLAMKNVPDEARDAAVSLAEKGEHVSRDRAKTILREHGVSPSRRDAGRPRKTRNAANPSPGERPADVVRELRASLDAFSDRLDEWSGELGDDVRLELSNVFLELALKLKHDQQKTPRIARKRGRATAAA